jgi:hypothetical protein
MTSPSFVQMTGRNALRRSLTLTYDMLKNSTRAKLRVAARARYPKTIKLSWEEFQDLAKVVGEVRNYLMVPGRNGAPVQVCYDTFDAWRP